MNIDKSINVSVNGKTKLFGLIGNPVTHTISPQIHNTLAQMMGIDMIYVPLEVPGDKLENAVKGLMALGFHGFNITIPYKEKVTQYLDGLDESAEKYDAVNTVHIKDGRLTGYNTDADGFYRSFTEAFGTEVKGRRVLFVGAGGAASSLACALAEKGAASVTIANRTMENALKICERVGENYNNPINAVILKDDLDISGYDVIINTTSVGMHPNEDKTILGAAAFNSNQKVVDIIYTPSETLFLKRAREAGAATLNGFGMLFYQAVLAFERWNGVKVPDKVGREIYEAFSRDLEKILKYGE